MYSCSDAKPYPSVTCQPISDIELKIRGLKVQFIYLETNFEGKNIQNPLNMYLKEVLAVGLDIDYVEQV